MRAQAGTIYEEVTQKQRQNVKETSPERLASLFQR